ncbi:MAG: STAS domain-containing protein [Planctomycetota bacterium]|jgi:anti-anti-sigma regulatory factor
MGDVEDRDGMGDADDRAGAEFVREGKKLKVKGELRPDDETRYSEELADLVDLAQTDLELDLTELDYVNSSYIGATSLAVLMAKQSSKKITVIAGSRVARVLKMIGLDQMTKVEVVGD